MNGSATSPCVPWPVSWHTAPTNKFSTANRVDTVHLLCALQGAQRRNRFVKALFCTNCQASVDKTCTNRSTRAMANVSYKNEPCARNNFSRTHAQWSVHQNRVHLTCKTGQNLHTHTHTHKHTHTHTHTHVYTLPSIDRHPHNPDLQTVSCSVRSRSVEPGPDLQNQTIRTGLGGLVVLIWLQQSDYAGPVPLVQHIQTNPTKPPSHQH